MTNHRIRDQRQPKHFWADNEIVDHYLPQIGMNGFAVYMLLCRYTNNDGQCDPSIAGMASRLQVTQPTVRKAVKALEAAQLIEVKRGRSTAKGDPDTHLYTLLTVKGRVLNEVEGVLNGIEEGTKSGIGGVLYHVSPNNTDLEQDSKNKTPIHLTQPADAVVSRASDPLGDDMDSQPFNPKTQALLKAAQAKQATERLATAIQESTEPTEATSGSSPKEKSSAKKETVELSEALTFTSRFQEVGPGDYITHAIASTDTMERTVCGKPIEELLVIKELPYAHTLHACDKCQSVVEGLKATRSTPAPQPTDAPLSPAQKRKSKEQKPKSDLPPVTKEAKDALALACYGTVTAWNYELNARAMGKALRECKNPTADQINAHQRWWNVNDFRGRKGQRPKPHQVAETWAEFLDGKDQPNANGRYAPTDYWTDPIFQTDEVRNGD